MAKKSRRDNVFIETIMPKVSTNSFDLSHSVKLTGQMGELIPSCVIECLPGDKFDMSVENMVRFAPLVAPVMAEMNVTSHFFFVPNRLLWSEWPDWITGKSEVEAPYVNLGNVGISTIWDYLGIPAAEYTPDLKVSPMAVAAYYLIYDEYYRDQNLIDPKFVPLVAGENAAYDALGGDNPLRRAWMHDYFTSCLPDTQQGTPVKIPLVSQDNIPVEYQFRTGGINQNTGAFRYATDGTVITDGEPIVATIGPSPLAGGTTSNAEYGAYDPQGTLVVDVQADAVELNELRRAEALQKFLEKTIRGGQRYIETILAHFGVRSSDARLQRPEYVGGTKHRVVISEVLATAQDTADDIPLGEMAGHALGIGGGNKFNYYCEEHGFIIGITNVQPESSYMDGVHKGFTRFDRLDYMWPDFANLGEQAVKMQEVYAYGDQAERDSTFGYMPRYSEYRFINSRVAAEFRATLRYWTLVRQLQTTPALNEDFVTCRPDTNIFAVTAPGNDHLWCHIFNNIRVTRKLPRYGIPRLA